MVRQKALLTKVLDFKKGMSTTEGQEDTRKAFFGLAERSLVEAFELDEQHEDCQVYSGQENISIKHAELKARWRISSDSSETHGPQ